MLGWGMAHPQPSACQKTETKRAITLVLKTNYFDYQKDNSLEPRFSKPAAAEKSPGSLYRERSQQKHLTQMMDQVLQDEASKRSLLIRRRTQAEATSNRGGASIAPT